MIRLSKFLFLFVSKKADKERVKEKNRMKYYTKDNIKFVTWKYDAGVPCLYLNQSVDIVNVLLLNDSRKLQGFFSKGYFVKNILKKNKKKFLPGNFYVQDSPKELNAIQDIKLYDKTGKIVFIYDNGSVSTIVETTFNGYSVLQSVLQKINESM